MAARIRKRASGTKPQPVNLVGMKRSAAFSIIARHQIEKLKGNEGEELDSQQLIARIPLEPHDIASIENTPAARTREVVSPDRFLGLSVKRITRQGKEFPGRVTALRGIVRLIDGDRQQRVCTGLIEVEFDQYLPPRDGKAAQRKETTPTLDGDDAGALVVAWDGGAVGIIVGGNRRRAFVAPLKAFVEHHGLTLGLPSRDTDKAQQSRARGHELLQRGTQTYLEELAREPPLELHEWPEKVA